MLGKVTAALGAIEAEGKFATELECGSDDLYIEVEGVGPIRFPISAAAARKLCAVARPAPFGRRDQTLHDKRVRDTWEIDARLVKIDTRRWSRTLEPKLELIRQRLGLPEGGRLEAALDKMLVYGPGMFFAPHQDSERDDDMVGSLVVELPSQHQGGAVVVQHHREKEVFRGAPQGPKDLSLLAFYADCHHEVKPVKAGYRITLVYHLLFRGAAAEADGTPLDARAVERLAASVKEYFATPVPKRYAPSTRQRPDRLIYLLDHEYTQRSLGWDRLKNADRLRAAALREVAGALECEVFLTLADVHECWSCEDGEWGYRYGWRRSDQEGEGRDAEDHEIIELISSEIELRDWIGADGRRAAGMAAHLEDDEICFTRASSEMDPFRSEHEGYMGNYGNTVDRWYHRAAIVMWPRERDFVVRAKVSPSSAVKELASRIKAGALDRARAGARDLLPFWRGAASREASATFALQLLEVAASLDDEELALGLLAPLGPHRLSARAIPVLVRLVVRHGLAWSQRLFTTWDENTRHNASQWLPLLPRLCEALRDGGGQGPMAAEWLLRREAASWKQRLDGERRLPAVYLEESIDRYLDELLALLEGAAVVPVPAVRDDLIAFVMAPETRLPLLSAGSLLQRCLHGRAPAAVRALGLEALYQQVVDLLERAVSAPARSPDDWSIVPPPPCACALCKQLSAFLGDRDRIRYEWPLASHGRGHIHQVIDDHRLPVTHVTTRRGSPYTLVLTKQRALFERDATLRAQQRKLLTWLNKQRGVFCASSTAAPQ